MRSKLRIVTLIILFLCAGSLAFAINENAKKFTIRHKDTDELVYYDIYVPPHEGRKRMPVLVCTGGLPIFDGKYAHSNTAECFDDAWKDFAARNRIAIVGLGFLFKERDWDDKTSYQYPDAWSGKAADEILKNLSKEYPINRKKLYLWGVSAGAQFSVRYAFLHPRWVKAVAAHAAGGFDEPKKRIPTKFLLTVGTLDNKEISRVNWAKFFVEKARKKGIDVDLVLIPGIGHRQTEPQNAMSRDFFEKILKGN